MNLCDIPEYLNSYTFIMQDGSIFESKGINLLDAFCYHRPACQFSQIEEWDRE